MNVSWRKMLGLETFLVAVLSGLSSGSTLQSGEDHQGCSRVPEALVWLRREAKGPLDWFLWLQLLTPGRPCFPTTLGTVSPDLFGVPRALDPEMLLLIS